MKKEADYYPQEQMYYPTSELDLNQQLAAYNQQTPETPIKESPLLAAGLGAGLGGGVLTANTFLDGKERHKDRIFKAVNSYHKNSIEPLSKSWIQKKIDPVGDKLANNIKRARIQKAVEFLKKHTTLEAIDEAGIKAVKRMPKSKLAIGVGIGGALGYLANKLLASKQKENK